MRIAPGTILEGKYELLRLIGRGGMGEVFAARRRADGSEVAIKVVSRTLVDETLMARLHREAVAAGRIKSERIPEVFEVGRTHDGELYLVMRLLHGVTLSQRMRDRGSVMMWDEVRLIVLDVLAGLADAHGAGVVHRDLKPGNVFLEPFDPPTVPKHIDLASVVVPTERAIILDFGVCKLDKPDTEKLTMTGEAVGTVAYMAPEQIRGASSVDGRADLYSLGVMIHEMLSGRYPYEGSGQMQLLAAKLEGKARPLHADVRVPVPEGLDVLLAKTLSRNPNDRPPSAEAMREQIEALRDAVVIPNTGHEPLPSGPATETGITSPTRSSGRTSRWALVGAAVAVALAAALILVAFQRREPAHGAAPPPSVEPNAIVPSASVETETETEVIEIEDTTADAGKKRIVVRPRTTPKPTPSAKPSSHIVTTPRY